jgi:hypothetical protein
VIAGRWFSAGLRDKGKDHLQGYVIGILCFFDVYSDYSGTVLSETMLCSVSAEFSADTDSPFSIPGV